MYSKILVPVDLAHTEALEKGLTVAADLAKHYGAEICYVGVTAAAPSSVAHNPAEFEQKLTAFGAAEAGRRGINATTKMIVSHDPAVDVDDVLIAAISEIGADLVVMATHLPNIVDYLWLSNGGKIAQHSDVSVFLVRSQA